MNDAYSIRRFAPEDAAEVLNIIHRALREVCSKSYPADIIAEVCGRFSIEPDSVKMQSKKNGRGNRTRTCDLMLPKHALYQTELYPDSENG